MKKIFKLSILAFIISVASYSILSKQKSHENILTDITLSEVEAMASCEVKKNGEVIFRCDGEEEADCQDKYKAMFVGTIEIECSGTYVKL